MSEVAPTLTLDTPDLPLADYRAMREGREVPVPVVETPAADAAKPTTETAADSGTADPNLEVTTPGKPDKLNARFSELTGKIKTLEQQLATQKSGTGLTESVAKPAVAAPPVLAPDPSDPEPSADKFTDYVEWQKQWNRWDRRQETRQAAATAEAATRATAAQAKAETWNGRVKAATELHSDFEAVALNKDLPVSKVAGDAIADSEVGAEILYRLGSKPEEAARIAKLSAFAQVREIGKLEAAIEAEKAAAAGAEETEDEPLPKKLTVSKAPPPHKPVAGAAAASPAKNIDTMTQAEYRAYRDSGKIR